MGNQSLLILKIRWIVLKSTKITVLIGLVKGSSLHKSIEKIQIEPNKSSMKFQIKI